MKFDKRHRNYIRACIRFTNWTRESCKVDPLEHPKIAPMFKETIPLTLSEIEILDKQLVEEQYDFSGVYTIEEISSIINQDYKNVRNFIDKMEFVSVKNLGKYQLYFGYVLNRAHTYFSDKDTDFKQRFHLDEETK